jgi:enamine deaminase RidA (YjgF/YER057c/UK114 family)
VGPAPANRKQIALRVGDTVDLSGQSRVTHDGKLADGLAAYTRQTTQNNAEVLTSLGST